MLVFAPVEFPEIVAAGLWPNVESRLETPVNEQFDDQVDCSGCPVNEEGEKVLEEVGVNLLEFSVGSVAAVLVVLGRQRELRRLLERVEAEGCAHLIDQGMVVVGHGLLELLVGLLGLEVVQVQGYRWDDLQSLHYLLFN